MWLFTRGYPWLSPNSFPMFSLILVIPDTWQIAQGHSGDPWVFDRWIQLPILELDGKDRGKVLESLRCWGAVHLAPGWDKANVRPIRWKPGQTWQIWVNLDFSWHVLVTLGKSWRFKLVWLVGSLFDVCWCLLLFFFPRCTRVSWRMWHPDSFKGGEDLCFNLFFGPNCNWADIESFDNTPPTQKRK